MFSLKVSRFVHTTCIMLPKRYLYSWLLLFNIPNTNKLWKNFNNFFSKKNHVNIFVYWCKMTSCMMLKRPTNISQCSILSKKCTFDNRIFFEYWWKILCFSLWRILNFDAWWIFQIGDLENFLVAHLLHIFDQKNITYTTESKQMLLKFQNTCNSIFFARC